VEPATDKEVKVTKPKKKADKEVVEIPSDKEVKVTKPKKKADKEVVDTPTDKEVKVAKVIKLKKKAAIEPPQPVVEATELIKQELIEPNKDHVQSYDTDLESSIKQKLEKTKKHWLLIVENIHNCHLELEKWENEKSKTVKELKDLLDQLQTDDNKVKGFMIDNKVTTTNIKNDIIPIDSDSSDSESNDESSDSDEKQTLLTKKGKTKTLIKTTKGNTKNIKLINNDSGSESD
jgi:hypothetical protein